MKAHLNFGLRQVRCFFKTWKLVEIHVDTTLMLQTSGDHQLRFGSFFLHYLQGFSTIPGGCLGFLQTGGGGGFEYITCFMFIPKNEGR